MSNKHLVKYVEGKNWARRLFGEPQLDVNNLTTRDITELLDRIEGARGMAKPDRLDPLDCLSAEERAGFRAALEKVKARAEELYGVED